MATNQINITFDIESIVKLTCAVRHCQHNNVKEATCNLKALWIDTDGSCGEYRSRVGDFSESGKDVAK
jgi:hypothetical protein